MVLHAAGQAIVYWERESFYLGKDGNAAASKAYLRLITRLEERFHAKTAGVPEPMAADAPLLSHRFFLLSLIVTGSAKTVTYLRHCAIWDEALHYIKVPPVFIDYARRERNKKARRYRAFAAKQRAS